MFFDKVFALAAFAVLVWFMYIVMSFVAEPDLMFIGTMGISVAAYFLWREIAAGGSHIDESDHSHHP